MIAWVTKDASALASLVRKFHLSTTRIYDGATLYRSSSVARARSVPWVAALRGYALTLSASSAGLSVNFKLDTGGASLSAGDLPIASGTGPPSLAGSAPIEVGLRYPGALAAFRLEAERISSPATFATFLKGQATLRRKTGVDLSSLLGQLTGDLVINSDAHNVMGGVAVGNAAAATAILASWPPRPAVCWAEAR